MKTPKVAIFGLLGAGNLGNDGSFDAMLRYLRRTLPGTDLTCVGTGSAEFERRYGVTVVPYSFYHRFDLSRFSGPVGGLLKLFGKFADFFRTAWWIRRYDVVIVPGMGVLETTLPVRPWGFPYALLLVCLWGRLLGAKVALVSIGGEATRQPVARWVIRQAARLAYYRSYRDELSRDAMQEIGVDTSRDRVFPDLAFALPATTGAPAEPGTVGIGVMAFYGTYLDRRRADEIHAAYVGALITFVRWLRDAGHPIRLFIGDRADAAVVDEIIAAVGSDGIRADGAETLEQLTDQMSAVDVVIASRYHNVLTALKLAKPTISISYAAKSDVLMAGMGVGEYCQPIREVDAGRLIEQFERLLHNSDDIEQTLHRSNKRNHDLLAEQDALLTEKLFALPPRAA